MKTKNKLGHSPLNTSIKDDSQYNFIPNRESGEKIEITTSPSTENKSFDINEEFSKEKENRLQRINSDSFQIDEIPHKMLNTLKSFLKI